MPSEKIEESDGIHIREWLGDYELTLGNIQLCLAYYPDVDNGDDLHLYWVILDGDSQERAFRGVEGIEVQMRLLNKAKEIASQHPRREPDDE